MSYRRANNLSTFFPEKYGTDENFDSKHKTEFNHNSYHRKDTYVPSHKDIFIPNGHTSKTPSSGRSYALRHNHYEDSPTASGRHTPYLDRRTDKYVPSPATTTSSRSPSLPKNSVNNNRPTSSTPAISSKSTEERDVAKTRVDSLWKVFRDVKYSNQSHQLLEDGSFHRDQNTISQLEKPSSRIAYDPELKKDPLKGSSAIYHKSDKSQRTIDPRKDLQNKKHHQIKKFKKIPFKALPLPKLLYDKHSIGGPPPNEIVISGLAKAFNETYLRNEIKSHGEILEFENVMDIATGTPLGIVRIKFGGSPAQAYRSARHSVSALNGSKIETNTIHVGINKDGKLLDVLKSKILKERVSKAKKVELQEKKVILPTAPKAVLHAISKRENMVAAATASPIPHTKVKSAQQIKPQETNVSSISTSKPTQIPTGPKEEKIIVKKKSVVPQELEKYVKGRPFILILSKYVKGKVEKTDIKKALETYDWTRVLFDPIGVLIVFNSVKEAQRCYQFANGKKVLTVNLYMELHLPEGHKVEDSDKSYASTQRDVVEEATSLLVKELESAVQKDIRTKIIAPAVLEFLNIDNFPDLKAKIVPVAPSSKPATSELKEKSIPTDHEQDESTVDVFALHRTLPKIPSLKKKDKSQESIKGKRSQKRNKKSLPLSYRLNFENDSESDFRESTVSTPQFEAQYKEEKEDGGDDEMDVLGPPKKKSKILRKNKKDQHPLLYSSSSEDEGNGEEEDDDEQNVKSKESQPTTPETPEVDKIVVEKESPEEEQHTAMDIEADVDYSKVEKRFRPTSTDFPRPVYEENDDTLLDINGIQEVIKDEEDLNLLKELYQEDTWNNTTVSSQYTFWKLKNSKVPDKQQITPDHLSNMTGSHRSEGYIKMSDELKIEYLPHRKRVHDPLNTIQVENEENESSRVQSSRVNRANNRRFAYEVSTFNTQNEILTLNQLNKRKKPVSFARSAIHNWGLYALEPIAQKEMIIEYVGERIRQQVADFREKAYLKSGIGSSYLFRIDENTVIDATKKGGIARFINHCCQPSCTAKIIKVEGQKRIVIYALRDIAANEELTYDYKFERETNDNERVRCLCGAPGCKGYLN